MAVGGGDWLDRLVFEVVSGFEQSVAERDWNLPHQEHMKIEAGHV